MSGLTIKVVEDFINERNGGRAAFIECQIFDIPDLSKIVADYAFGTMDVVPMKIAHDIVKKWEFHLGAYSIRSYKHGIVYKFPITELHNGVLGLGGIIDLLVYGYSDKVFQYISRELKRRNVEDDIVNSMSEIRDVILAVDRPPW
jgi:hypothetical protein